MSETAILVEKAQFDSLMDIYAGQHICENRSVPGTFVYAKKEYVVTSGGSYNGERVFVGGYRVVDLSIYKGDVKPMEYADHNYEVRLNRRERGYVGMIIRQARRKLVCVERVEFRPGHELNQLSIF